MKRIALLLTVFAAGLLASSFAFADNSRKGPRPGETESSSTSTSKNEGKGNDKKCHNVSLKGTAAATSFTITVDKGNHAARDLKSATLTFSGKVNVNAMMCSGDASGSAATFQLRNLKVSKPASQDDDG